MSNLKLKTTFVLMALLIACANASAKRVPGYIVTLEGDTVRGVVKVPKVNQLTYTLYILGHDMDSFFEKVYFKAANAHRKETYLPGSIKQFGFTYRSDDYCYVSFPVTYQSLVKSEKTLNRFLKQIHKGSINLLMVKDRQRVQMSREDRHLATIYKTEFFLQHKSMGPVKVSLTDKMPDLKLLLLGFDMREEFVALLPDTLTGSDLPALLADYDAWLAERGIGL